MSFTPRSTSQQFGRAGQRPPLFQPPKSPASVAASPAFATADETTIGSRKRQRADDSLATQSLHAETPSWPQCLTPGEQIFSSGFGQHSGLVNEKYLLNGGFDTPSLESTNRLEQLKPNKHEFRRRLRDEDMGNGVSSDAEPIFGPLARERNGMPRMPVSPSEPSKTWTNAAFGLVGKVFTFGTSVFKGFVSGGGQAYDQNNYPLVGSDLLQEGVNRDHNHTPIPGSWCQDEFLGDFEQDSPAFAASRTDPTERPQNKRRQTDRDTWVVVGNAEAQDSPLSPERKPSNYGVSRSNLSGRPTASRASSRRSTAPRRTTSSIATNGSPAQQFSTPTNLSQLQGHNRRASLAPARSPQRRPGGTANDSPYFSPEAERHAKRQAKQDKAMSNMGRRMEDLIRQAQEALGTKVSVEGDGIDIEDEGFVDDDW